MSRESAFSFSSYKSAMAHYLTGNENRGMLAAAARSLNCQRSYLSRVISEEIHLTPDHAFNLAKFLRFDGNERDYFLLLVDVDRAADPVYRDFLKSKISILKKNHDSVQERTHRTSLSLDAHQVTYFSSWLWSAIHFLTSIPRYQEAETLADRLGLRQDLLIPYLKALESRGFIHSRNGKWIYKGGDFHAPKDSPLTLYWHQNWRNRALVDAQNHATDGVHFTQVQTVSFEDFSRIKELLLTFISEASHIAGPSKPEEGIAVTCDIFRF